MFACCGWQGRLVQADGFCAQCGLVDTPVHSSLVLVLGLRDNVQVPGAACVGTGTRWLRSFPHSYQNAVDMCV